MSKTQIAKLFQNGGSQAVRLPQQFRFVGDQVRIRRVANGVLLEPCSMDATQWLQKLDEYKAEPILPKGRKQPATPRRKIFL